MKINSIKTVGEENKPLKSGRSDSHCIKTPRDIDKQTKARNLM